MSNKRRRNEIDVVSTTDQEIVDFLDRDPYLFRSIQALIWFEHNQLPFIEGNDPEFIFKKVTEYIREILNKFFVFDDHKIVYSDFNTHEITDMNYHNFASNQKEETIQRKRYDFDIDMGFEDYSEYSNNMSFIVSRLDGIFNKYLENMTNRINELNKDEKINLSCSIAINGQDGILVEMQWSDTKSYGLTPKTEIFNMQDLLASIKPSDRSASPMEDYEY